MTLDEKLIAYVDGQLTGDEAKAFEAEVAADPRLADEVEKHRTMAARLAMAYAPVIEGKAKAGAKSAARGKPAASRPAAKPSLGLVQWAVLAAALVVGVGAGVAGGYYLWPASGPLITRSGTLVANGALKAGLTDQLMGQAGPLRIGVTFRTAGGRYCRTFLSADDNLAGLACRTSDGWVMQTTTATKPPPVTPAALNTGVGMPAAVIAAVDAVIAGLPLDAAAEKAAHAKGWK